MAMWNPLVVIIMQSLEDTMCPPTENFSHHKKSKKKCLIQVKHFFEVTTRPYSSFTKPENLRAARFREAVVVEGRRVALSVYRCLKQQKEDFGGMSKLLKHELLTMWWCGGLLLTSKSLEGRFNFKKPFLICASCNNCGRAFLGELCVNSFPWWIPTLWLCLDSTVRPLRLCWVKGAC